MTKERKPRYSLCSIITDDSSLLIASDSLRAMGETHESIYRAGIEALTKNNTKSQ